MSPLGHAPSLRVNRGEDGLVHVHADRPGVAAVSVPVGDPIAFILEVATAAGLEVDEATIPDSIVISR